MTDQEILRFSLSVIEYAERYPRQQLDPTLALDKFRKILDQKYEDCLMKPIEWWITQNPERQYTASINPCMEDPVTWYGQAAFDPKPKTPTTEMYVETLLSILEGRQLPAEGKLPVYDGLCPLCQDTLFRGAPNSVILGCGHIFHWSGNELGCSGLHSWVKEENKTCPSCRTSFSSDEEEDDPASVPMSIDW